MTDFIPLLDYWRIRRMMRGEPTVIRPCHKVKAEALTALLLGQLPTPNLMILEPPRVGKTDLGVKTFESWALSYFPDSEFINGSVTSDLAQENTRSIRDDLTSQWYRDMCSSDWGCTVEMMGDKAGGRQDYFRTRQGGGVKGVGMGKAVIGFGAGKLREEFGGAILIDDPLKPQDKNSAAIRKQCVDWFHDGLEPRRNRKDDPMTPIALIMQRLHPQDLAGYLLSTERHRWTVIQIPAIDEAGASIWPSRISLKELEHMREYDPDNYWAQMMQQPSDAVYKVFHNEWWRYWKDINEVEKRITLKIITADTAFKEKDSADWSVFQCWGFEGTKGMYLLGQDRGKWEFPELLKHGKEFIKKHSMKRWKITPATEAWVEDKASGTSLVQTLKRAGLPFREWNPPNADDQIYSRSTTLAAPGRDKVARANQTTFPASMGRVYLPYPALPGMRWVEGWIGEHGAFTKDDSHLYDDQVDAYTMASIIWQQRGGGVGPVPEWDKETMMLQWPPLSERRAA